MHITIDEDEWETIVESRQCTACGGHMRKCVGGRCNGSFGVKQIRRPHSEVMKIKALRERQREDTVLAEADAIRARRELGS